jgi:uncharacterized damage-inducible protein DinB
MEIPNAFIAECTDYLENHYLKKISNCVAQLTDEEIWWRPQEASNSIGNLILHLCGNVRQWVISSAGPRAFNRERQQEFDERRIIARAELLTLLQQTVSEAIEVLNQFDVNRLSEKRMVQGSEVTLLHAIFHATEHFSMHTGQIIYITKMIKGQDLSFYRFENGVPVHAWQHK